MLESDFVANWVYYFTFVFYSYPIVKDILVWLCNNSTAIMVYRYHFKNVMQCTKLSNLPESSRITKIDLVLSIETLLTRIPHCLRFQQALQDTKSRQG